jgi:dual-specificity kinase
MHDYFYLNNNLCLVFEILEQNLFEYLEDNNFRPLPIRRIRYIVEQILIALVKLKV